MDYADQTFEEEVIDLDGNAFERCIFITCEFVYRGETPARLAECKIVDPDLTLAGPAAQTIDFLTVMYKVGFKEQVNGALRNIRKGSHPT